MKLSSCISISDLKILAQKKIPSVMFDYIQGGAEDEWTLNRNKNAFEKYEFKPRILRDVAQVDLSVTVQGKKLEIPIIAAPTGLSCMFHYQGEKAVARASHKVGTAYSLSTVSTTSIEEIAKTSNGPLFFQIYIWHNREMVFDFINRCKANNYLGLMLAVDMAAFGKRERDLRNGHGNKRLMKWNTAKSAFTKPAWLFNYLTHPKWRVANMVDHLPHGAFVDKVTENINSQFDASVDWADAKELMQKWGGKFILKGIQSVEDAVLASEMGATGIVISNHGGRQLDGSPATLDLLPEIAKAVGSKLDVMIDGGITRGSDVIKALALGAKACLIGKSYLYGLAAGGEKGVDKCYQILIDEMIRTMQLIGCRSIKELDESYLRKLE